MPQETQLADEIRRYRDHFAAGHTRYPDLQHATLRGRAIHDEPEIRKYLQENIANGKPFEQFSGKVRAPFSFYFGNDLAGISLFDSLAGDVLEILNMHTGKYHFGSPDLSDFSWDDGEGEGHTLLACAYSIGKTHNQSLLLPARGRIRIGPRFPLIRSGDFSHPDLVLPDESIMHMQRAGADPYSLDPLDDFHNTIAAIQRQEVEEVSIYRRGVFLAAQMAIEHFCKGQESISEAEDLLSAKQVEILQAMLLLDCTNSDKRQSAADIAKKAQGNQADPGNFKKASAELVKKGFTQSKQSSGGGAWLTAKGIERAEKQ